MPSTFGNLKYMPWGADNQMPYNIIDLIERDETLATCLIFNAEGIIIGANLNQHKLIDKYVTNTGDGFRCQLAVATQI